MKKKFRFSWLLLLVCCYMMTACRPVVMVYEMADTGDISTEMNAWEYTVQYLLDKTFALWFAIVMVVAAMTWHHGYKWLEWVRRQKMTCKVIAILATQGIVFAIGLISLNVEKQCYGGWFAFPVVAAIGFTLLLVKTIWMRYQNQVDSDKRPDSYKRQQNLKLLAVIMAWVWSYGWVLHFVAISIAKQPHVGAELLFRSAICSFQLFGMNFDGNLLDAIESHDVLKGLIVCTGFVAVLCMVTLIVSLVISRLMAHLHVKHLNIDDQHNHLYVFFGLDDASKRLADDICSEQGDPKGVILYVVNNLASQNDKHEDQTDGWDSVKSIFTHRRKTFVDAHEDERHALAFASCGVCSLDAETTDVWGNIGRSDVKQLIGRGGRLGNTKKPQLHIFFLSEDRDTNVRAASKMAQDVTLAEAPCEKIHIYCHARRNGVNKVIEKNGSKIDVKILDSSHLSLEHLKRDVRNHPISFVNVETLTDENPGTVADTFTSLVVGFGETGQEAVQFLYEFGAFVSDKASAGDSFRSPFVCHVVDNNMDRLEGEFIAAVPGVSCEKSTSSIPDAFKKSSAPIKFHKCDYRSTEFYENILAPIAKNLNYVVVTLGDDETSITVAVEMLRYIKKHRPDMKNFRIYVRAYEKGTFKHLEDIARHYNQFLHSSNDNTDKIVLFGQSQQIYTYQLVVRDQYEEEGKTYYETYRSLKIDPANDEGPWDERRNRTLDPSKDGTLWEKKSKIRRKESQDRSNALHADTKLLILEKAVGAEHAQNFAQRALRAREGQQKDIHYPNLSDAENTLMLNLAICEHLRWNAAHEMLGYVNNTTGHNCDERTKRHNCLKPWQELDLESDASIKAGNPIDYKIFDFGVVETGCKLRYGEE